MKTRVVDALAIFPRPAQAANEEFGPVPRDGAASGWNAYEVWRTRIKTRQRNQPSRTPRVG